MTQMRALRAFFASPEIRLALVRARSSLRIACFVAASFIQAGDFAFTRNCKLVGWRSSTYTHKRKFIMKRIVVASLLVGLSVVAPNVVLAQAGDSTKKDPNGMDMKGVPTKSMDMKGMDKNQNVATATHQGIGVVKGVNVKDGVITVAHEPIKSLSWPAMTMGFKVKDKHLVEKIKAGDKVEFTFVQAGNDYVVTAIR